MRSSWKGQHYTRAVVSLARTDSYEDKKRFRYQNYARSSVIPSFLLGNRVLTYVGSRFLSVVIRPEMVGHRFGQFYFTKKTGTVIHSPKKKGKGAKKKK